MPIAPTSATVDGKSVTMLFRSVSDVWSVNGGIGSLYLNIGATTPYAGENVTTVYFKANNKTASGSVSCGGDFCNITVYGVFPRVPNYPWDMSPTKRGVVVNKKRDGSINGRILGDGVLRRDYRLSCLNNWVSQYTEVETFWNDHMPNLKFRYYDYLLNIGAGLFFQFDSEIKVTAQSLNRINYEVAITQVP
jgi:hypothetical protein